MSPPDETVPRDMLVNLAGDSDETVFGAIALGVCGMCEISRFSRVLKPSIHSLIYAPYVVVRMTQQPKLPLIHSPPCPAQLRLGGTPTTSFCFRSHIRVTVPPASTTVSYHDTTGTSTSRVLHQLFD